MFAGAHAMELPNSAYLYTLALIAVGFVGFSAIVLILRQTAGAALSPLDTIVARLFMTRGFTVTYLSLLPMLLAAFDLNQSEVWRISSALCGGMSRGDARGLPDPARPDHR